MPPEFTKEVLTEQLTIAKLQKEIAEARRDEAKATQELKSRTTSGAAAAPVTKPAVATPTALQRAKDAKALAEAERDATLAHRKMYEGPAVTPPTGDITLTGSSIEPQILAHQTLRQTLAGFEKDFATHTAGRTLTLVLLNPPDIPALELYSAVREQVLLLQAGYSNSHQEARAFITGTTAPAVLASPAPAAAFSPLLLGTAAHGILSSAATLLGLFRTSATFTNTDLAIDNTLLIATFAQVIQQQHPNWKVYAPAVLPPSLIPAAAAPPAAVGSSSASVLALFEQTEQVHYAAQATLRELQNSLAQYQIQLAAPPPGTDLAQLQQQVERNTDHITKLQSLGAAFSQLQQALIAPDGPLASLTRAERLAAKLQGADAYFVVLHATSKGSTQIAKNLWHDSHLQFSAGTELSYLVLQPNGEIFFAGTQCAYTPYQESNKIKAL